MLLKILSDYSEKNGILLKWGILYRSGLIHYLKKNCATVDEFIEMSKKSYGQYYHKLNGLLQAYTGGDVLPHRYVEENR